VRNKPTSCGGAALLIACVLSVEFAVLTLDPVTKAPRAKIYKPSEIDALLLAEGLTKQDEDTVMSA
jgi:hypothetical protein